MRKQTVRIVFLGGISQVTKNMFVYELRENGKIKETIIVDCGVGFPEEGDELLTPDISYLEDKKEKIRGIILTHAHEDHRGALFKVLPQINVPVYGTRLTLALAKIKLDEYQILANLQKIKTSTLLRLGSFQIEFVHVTHSVPDSTNLIIKTPIGTFYHASDFKFDWTPVDNWQTEVGKIARAGERGILCLLSDCVRSERAGYTLSERMIEEELEQELRKAKSKFIFTSQSSDISRIQQAANTALHYHRKIVFLGRSMKQNVEVAKELGYLKIPKKEIILEKVLKKYPTNKLFLIAAGSQGQEDSALSRLANNKNRLVKIKSDDVVVFSSDPIPGYEKQVHDLIDRLTLLGAQVVYSEINDELHVSGHGAQNDLMLMIALTKPRYLIPIGGAPRHVRQYSLLAQKVGYDKRAILTPQEGEAVEFDAKGNIRLLRSLV